MGHVSRDCSGRGGCRIRTDVRVSEHTLRTTGQETEVRPEPDAVTSQVTSQSDDLEIEAAEVFREIGSLRWTIFATG